MSDPTPWHRPGQWLVNPAYWDAEAIAARAHTPAQAFIIDATLPEGDDCVGHQLNWNTRLELMVRLDQVGVDAITLPSHATSDLEVDLVRSYRRSGARTPLVAKGPGFALPLRGEWKTMVKRQIDVGAEFISPSFLWSYADTTSDFSGDVTKRVAIEAIQEAMAYMKQQGAKVIPWIDDTMRMRVDTATAFARVMAESGADGVYLVDSRGNSTPLATRVLVHRIRSVVGSCPLYVQHHNDLGVATANALAAVESGAAWIDASVLGIGDRGGCVALEEIAVLLAMYGVRTRIHLDALYELGRYVRDAFGVELSPWKPLIGDSWNKEEGRGHLSGADGSVSEATIGVAPEVIGRQFEAVIGGKILFGRERSSVLASESALLRDLVSEWGWAVDDAQFAIILQRARAAVATSYGRHYLRFDEFRSICEGVLGTV